MFDTFTQLFDTLRSLLATNEPIDTEKIQTITSNKSNLLHITSNAVRKKTFEFSYLKENHLFLFQATKCCSS